MICSVCVLVLASSTASALANGRNGQHGNIDQQLPHQDQAKGKADKQPLSPDQSLWPPVDVDAAIPPVAPETACPLEEVLQAVRQRVEELAVNLDRFSAMETVDSAEVGRNGRLKNSLTDRFNYVATISRTRAGNLQFDESRRAVGKNGPAPIPIRTVGLALGAAIFHPSNIDDFDIICEGLGDWHGRPAWQLHFQERPESSSTFQAVYADRTWTDVLLRGRAWIDPASNQIEQIDFDLSRPIPRIRLVTEHMSVEYCAVDFAARRTEFWLPKSVDLYLDIGGHRYVNRRQLTNYILFAVDTNQEFRLPREPN